MGKALYRKYRSRSLREIIGQPQVTELLSRALTQGRIAHAYLFTGPKGTGKTSVARILAHEINDLPYTDESTHLDIIEIDAASNNGVDDIRDLREKVRLAPVSAKKKIYIIDEVHMLSKQAFNALLKTLEEPPAHVVFILATTDIDKVPDTILSRTQRHSFRRAGDDAIVQNLQRIAQAENISVSPDALHTIARHSDGSFRDSVSIFDQLISLADPDEGVSQALVAASLGLVSDDYIEQLVAACMQHDIPTIVGTLHELEQDGMSVKTILHQLSEYLHTHITKNVHYAKLLDQLLDLHKSTNPDLKLLTTLSLYASSDISTPDTPTIQPARKPSVRAAAAAATAPSFPIGTPTASSVIEPKPSAKKNEVHTKIEPANFDWETLLAHVRSHHVALHSVLSQCQPALDGDTLTLYTKNKFYKTKLDSVKFRALLASSLQESGMSELTIETKPTAAPLKDSQAAKVAAMMGGGVEVKLEEDS
ncbi:DNA polymerase III subunit gamma/tau [Candidatus Saccharibacteria bacterium]|nr:DNA polymerase III subunit gamma/tau [Candidatus Saccharibacteria bacterium]